MEGLLTNTVTQKERFKNILSQLKVDITANDRDECVKEVKISEPTLKRYLSGHIGDNDKAAEIIKFFKKKISLRDLVAA